MHIVSKQPVPQRVGKDEVARIDAETQAAEAKKSSSKKEGASKAKVGATKKPAKKTGVKSKKK